jgi:hypothetical protein
VAILDEAINAEIRDRQTEQDQMMLREFRQNLFFIGQNIAFREDVMGGRPIEIPGGQQSRRLNTKSLELQSRLKKHKFLRLKLGLRPARLALKTNRLRPLRESSAPGGI